MVKDDETVIQEFNELVNMSAKELQGWLGSKIFAILQKNPNKDPSKYDEEDIQHMRKVVSYCRRHLAQEGKAKQDPDSKSARSLRNWGHNPQKT